MYCTSGLPWQLQDFNDWGVIAELGEDRKGHCLLRITASTFTQLASYTAF